MPSDRRIGLNIDINLPWADFADGDSERMHRALSEAFRQLETRLRAAFGLLDHAADELAGTPDDPPRGKVVLWLDPATDTLKFKFTKLDGTVSTVKTITHT